jgi:hypothetical protein
MTKNIQDLEMPTCNDQLLWDVTLSVYHVPTLMVAVELELFPFLEKTPATFQEVATHFSLNPKSQMLARVY